MTAIRTYFQNAFECTLRDNIGVSDTVFKVTDVGILQAPCLLVIEPDSNTKREFFYVTAIDNTPGAETFTVGALTNRYLPGSAETANLTHLTADTATIYCVAQARHFEDLHDLVDDLESGKLDVTAKAADSDKLDALDSTYYTTLTATAQAAADAAQADATQALSDASDAQDTADATTLVADAATPLTTFNAHGHPLAENDGADGFMSGDDKEKLDGMFPSDLNPLPIVPDETADGGISIYLSRNDHKHGIPAAGPASLGTVLSEGSSSSIARSDHVHRVSNMRSVGVTGDTKTAIPSGGLTSGYTTAISDAITKPSGWGSALVIAWGSAQYSRDTGVGSVQANGQIVIDTSTGSAVQSGAAIEDGDAMIVTPTHQFVTSESTINIGLQTKWTINSGSTPKYATLSYILIRAS